MIITANTKLKHALEEYPELKEFLIQLSPKFKKLNNPFIYRLVSHRATFEDIARTGGLSLCELLKKVNRETGNEKEFLEKVPECREEEREEKAGEMPEWVKDATEIVEMDVRKKEGFFLPEIKQKLKNLEKGKVLLVINDFYPAPLIKLLREEGHTVFHEAKISRLQADNKNGVATEEHRVYIQPL